MTKLNKITTVVFSLGLIFTLSILTTIVSGSFLMQTAYAQQTVTCATDVVIQSGDSLSSIALEHLGDSRAYPQIIDATNVKSLTDNAYAYIPSPDQIRRGAKVCIPAPEEDESDEEDAGEEDADEEDAEAVVSGPDDLETVTSDAESDMPAAEDTAQESSDEEVSTDIAETAEAITEITLLQVNDVY